MNSLHFGQGAELKDISSAGFGIPFFFPFLEIALVVSSSKQKEQKKMERKRKG